MAEQKINEKIPGDILKEGEILLIKAKKARKDGEEGVAVETVVNCTAGDVLEIMNHACGNFGLVCVPKEIIESMMLPVIMMATGDGIAEFLSKLSDKEIKEPSEENLSIQ